MVFMLKETKILNEIEKTELAGANNVIHPQITLAQPISCTGVGLHTGDKIKLNIKPNDVDCGIIFKRTDINGENANIKAHCNNIVDTRLNTCIGDDSGNNISTVEHLMSAFQALKIDNAIVEVSGPEIPIMDGSAESFAFLLKCAGTKKQNKSKKAIKITKDVSYQTGESKVSLKPAEKNSLTINFEIDFPDTVIGNEEFSFELDEKSFLENISSARTFGLMRDIEKLRTMGLAKGGSLENAVLVDGDVVVNEEGLRFDDEFVRHKILDALGDLYMIGYPIIGEYSAKKSGHFHTAELLKLVLSDSTSFELVDLDECEDRDLSFLEKTNNNEENELKVASVG